MKKRTVVALAVAFALTALAPSALAGDKTPKDIKCAVMASNKVNIKAATKKKMFADYKGRRYFFCCDGCPQAFKKDPAKFAKAPSIKTPKG